MSEQQLKFKPSSLSNNLAQEAANEELRKTENFDTLRKCYVNLMNQLLIDGIPREKVSTVGQKIVIDKKIDIKKSNGASEEELQNIHIGSWWYDVAREENFINPKYSHTVATEPERENTSLNTKQGPFYEENEQLIRCIDDFVEKTLMLKKYANHNKFISMVSPVILKDIFTRLDAFSKNFSDYLNNKQTVPKNAQLIFLLQYNASSDINNAFGLYFDEIKKIHLQNRRNTKKTNQILTPKEMKKFIGRELVSLCDQLEFSTSNQARLHGFYGQQCPNCKGFRTQIQQNNSKKVTCVRCFNLKDVDAFEREYFITCRRCRFIIPSDDVKNKCPHCKEEIIKPLTV